MTDTTVAAVGSTVLRIPITKAGKDAFVEIDYNDESQVHSVSLLEIYKLGLKELVNRGMSKVTKAAFNGDLVALAAKAMEIAQANVQKIAEGNIRVSGSRTKEPKGAIQTEAMRLARALVKKSIKDQGYKVGSFKASEITDFAKQLLASPRGQEITDSARANIAKREEESKGLSVDLSGVADLASKKAAPRTKGKVAEGQLSAAQAGKTAKRSKKGKGHKGATA